MTGWTLLDVATFLVWWLLASFVVSVLVGRCLRDADRAGRQLHEEERRRRDKLDELDNRRRRRPQR